MSSGHKRSISFTLCDILEGMYMISGFQKFLESNILCQYYLKNIYRFWVSDMQFFLYGIYSRMCGVVPWTLVILINCLEVLLLPIIIILLSWEICIPLWLPSVSGNQHNHCCTKEYNWIQKNLFNNFHVLSNMMGPVRNDRSHTWLMSSNSWCTRWRVR